MMANDQLSSFASGVDYRMSWSIRNLKQFILLLTASLRLGYMQMPFIRIGL